MSETSNLDLLEEKIARAIARIAALKEENQALHGEKDALLQRLRDAEEGKGALAGRVESLEAQLRQAEGRRGDLEALSQRVDGILAKFEVLEL